MHVVFIKTYKLIDIIQKLMFMALCNKCKNNKFLKFLFSGLDLTQDQSMGNPVRIKLATQYVICKISLLTITPQQDTHISS